MAISPQGVIIIIIIIIRNICSAPFTDKITAVHYIVSKKTEAND